MLAGCAEDQAANTQPTESGDSDVTVIDYPDKEVVCFAYRESKDTNSAGVGGTGGLSCLPYDDVNGYNSTDKEI